MAEHSKESFDRKHSKELFDRIQREGQRYKWVKNPPKYVPEQLVTPKSKKSGGHSLSRRLLIGTIARDIYRGGVLH